MRRTKRALGWLGFTIFFSAYWHLTGTPTLPVEAGHGEGGDGALFRAVATRVAAGEPYDPSMAQELTARHYPTSSVANWRTPLYIQLLARAPQAVRLIMILVGLLVLVGTGLYTL